MDNGDADWNPVIDLIERVTGDRDLLPSVVAGVSASVREVSVLPPADIAGAHPRAAGRRDPRDRGAARPHGGGAVVRRRARRHPGPAGRAHRGGAQRHPRRRARHLGPRPGGRRRRGHRRRPRPGRPRALRRLGRGRPVPADQGAPRGAGGRRAGTGRARRRRPAPPPRRRLRRRPRRRRGGPARQHTRMAPGVPACRPRSGKRLPERGMAPPPAPGGPAPVRRPRRPPLHPDLPCPVHARDVRHRHHVRGRRQHRTRPWYRCPSQAPAGA